MPKALRVLLSVAVVFLAACAPVTLSTSDARAAMKARMERPGASAVKVQQIHALELGECTGAVASGTVTCLVRMDVSFAYGGALQRDDGSQRMRFVRESGTWVAHPAE